MTQTPAADIVGLRQQPAFSANEMDVLRAEIEALRAREAELQGNLSRMTHAFELKDTLAGELQRKLDEAVELLELAQEEISRGNFEEGYCCCGDPMDAHGLGSGHAPVDQGEYHSQGIRDQIKNALASIRGEG